MMGGTSIIYTYHWFRTSLSFGTPSLRAFPLAYEVPEYPVA